MNPTSRLGVSILGAGLALGVLGDLLLRATPWGVNVALWIAPLLTTLIVLALRQRVALAGGGRWLIAPALFFAAAFAWRDSATLNFLNATALLIALALLALRARSGQVRFAGVLEYAQGIGVAGIGSLIGAFELLLDDIAWRSIPRSRWSKQAAAVGRGLLIALPLLLVFGGLFVAADAVFEDVVYRLFDWDFDEIVLHTALIAVWAIFAAGYLRRTLLAPADLQVPPALGRAPASIGLIEIGTALGALNALFFAFVVVQLRYFFGGAEVVEASIDLTYAEYARRGFFELVAIAVLALPTLLIAHWLLPKDDPRGERTFRGLAGALIAMLFVIMASAVQRMWLYQREFGLTELRLYTTAFMGWLAVVFVWFALTVLRGRRERFVFGALLAGFAAIGLLHLLNPDAVIVQVNIGRVDAPRPLDARYLAGLSADAVPTLIAALPSLREEDRCYVAARLLARWPPRAQIDWRTWNLARAQAQQAVEANRPALLAMACPAR